MEQQIKKITIFTKIMNYFGWYRRQDLIIFFITPLELSKDFIWTEEGYSNREYCYYCKANASKNLRVNANGYGCTNCKNYAERNTL